jgi:hypothetical protein
MQTKSIQVSLHAQFIIDDCQLTDLQHEAAETPRIVVHNESSAVADDLGGAAESDQSCERPLLPAVALVDMNKHADTEDGDEECVGLEVWLVLEDAPFDAACFEITLAPASLL